MRDNAVDIKRKEIDLEFTFMQANTRYGLMIVCTCTAFSIRKEEKQSYEKKVIERSIKSKYITTYIIDVKNENNLIKRKIVIY